MAATGNESVSLAQLKLVLNHIDETYLKKTDTPSIDLSNYYTKSETDKKVTAAKKEIFDGITVTSDGNINLNWTTE